MEELARLEARLQSLNELGDLFAAMQAMAASRVEAAQSALTGARSYTGKIESAISDAVSLLPNHITSPPASDAPIASMLVIVCSEHGFTGAFNRLLLEHSRSEAKADERCAVIGRRGASLAGEHGLSPAWTMSMATGIDGILPTARRIAARIRDADRLRIAFGKFQNAGHFAIEVRQVLPPDPRLLAPRQINATPLHHLDPGLLLRRLIDELLLAELVLALIESYSSENSARLQIMQSAAHNIREKIGGLRQTTRQLRQDAITSELLEVVAGGEAVVKSGAP